MLGKKVGIDLGSALTRVHVRGDAGVSADATVALLEHTATGPRVIAVGVGAEQVAIRPGLELRRGLSGDAVVDALVVDAVLRSALTRVCGRQRIFKPDVMVAVASTMRGTDRRLVLEICAEAGARSMYLIDRPLAAAIGASLPVTSPSGRLVVDIGSTLVDAAVIALEGAVTRTVVPSAGAHLTTAIAAHLSAVHQVTVSLPAAEEVKIEIASAVPLAEERTLRVAATRDGGRAEIVVSSREVEAAIAPWLSRLDRALAELLDETPAALLDDLRHRTGVLLSGGGALLRGLDRHVAAATGLPTTVANEPALVIARGTGIALESLDVVRRTFLYVR